tara:strand:+ start:73 stop:273 length:201 start_codon:yes stop_codon:yes gene_type:complete
MPKLKTRKSVSKRIKITKKKKGLRSKAGRRHLLSSKTTKRKRNLRKKSVVSAGEKRLIKTAMPYAQ